MRNSLRTLASALFSVFGPPNLDDIDDDDAVADDDVIADDVDAAAIVLDAREDEAIAALGVTAGGVEEGAARAV